MADDLFEIAKPPLIPNAEKWQQDQEKKQREQQEKVRKDQAALQAFQQWRENPNPKTGGELSRQIEPYVQQAVSMHVGQANPVLVGRAKRMALDAMQRYNPDQGTAIPTYLIGQLQGLKRVSRNQRSPIKLPERDVMDNRVLQTKTDEYTDLHGYEPSDRQLADFSGIPLQRIQKLRNMNLPMYASYFDAQGEEDEAATSPTVRDTSRSELWTQIVYEDLSPIDQKVMEWSLGLHGQPVLSTQEIAQRLRLSAGMISQRRKKIQDLLDEGEGLTAL